MKCRKVVNDMPNIPFKAFLGGEGKRKQQVWDGDIFPIQLGQQPYEATICIRGYSYHLIFGQQTNGWFLCIPNWEIGVELSPRQTGPGTWRVCAGLGYLKLMQYVLQMH